MAEPKLEDVVVILADPKSETRQLLRAAMSASGYRDVRDCPTLETLEPLLTSSVPPDLVICDTKMPDGDIFELIRRLRTGDIGENPFVPIIMLC